MIKHLAALLVLLASPAAAQQIGEVTLPASVNAAMGKPEFVLDTIRAWPVDWTARAEPDYLVQGAYASVHGGNMVYVFHRIVSLDSTGPVLGAEFELPGYGIESVSAHPAGAQLVMYTYLNNDPRCCPSGRQTVVLQRPQ